MKKSLELKLRRDFKRFLSKNYGFTEDEIKHTIDSTVEYIKKSRKKEQK
jgi:hypothetical protein